MITYDFNMQAKNADARVQIQITLDPSKQSDSERRMVASLHEQMMGHEPITIVVGAHEWVLLPQSTSTHGEYLR